MKRKNVKVNLIIHFFALAHALTVVVLSHLGLEDSLVLTILTIAMIVLISRLYDLPIDVTAALALVCCFAGFYLGTKGADIMSKLTSYGTIHLANVLTTIFVTEALGWITYFIAHKKSDVE